MANDLTAEFNDLLGRNLRFSSPIEELRATYQSAKPFPHVVVDNLFNASILDPLLTEISSAASHKWMNVQQDPREKTIRMRSATEIGPAGTDLLSIVHSAAFLYLLSEITGIWQLLPDPYLQGGGYAMMRRGDYFNVHSDRSIAYDTGLTRRIAMIIFLNKAWEPQYEGRLELWNHEATRCEVSIEPLFNRTVFFEVSDPNFHGVPTPIACPPDRMRQSFILYYHTVGIDGKSAVKPHTSVFAPRFYGTNRMTLRSMVREITPPLITRAVRAFLKRTQ